MFGVPVLRQLMKAVNAQIALKKLMLETLVQKKAPVMLFPGGVAEVFHANRETEEIVTSHKGFIKVGSNFAPLLFWPSNSLTSRLVANIDYLDCSWRFKLGLRSFPCILSDIHACTIDSLPGVLWRAFLDFLEVRVFVFHHQT
jgi:hypothetical protein